MSTSAERPDNYFAWFGLEVDYAIDSVKLRDAYERLRSAGGPPGAEALDRAYKTLADPASRGAYLLDFFGAPDEPQSLPGELAPVLDKLKSDAAAARDSGDTAAVEAMQAKLAAERSARLEQLKRLFAMPRGLPNAVSQRSRDSAMRAELNAIQRLDQLGSTL